MMGEYLEVFAAFKGGSRAPAVKLVGQNGIARTLWCRLFDPLTPTELDSCRLIPDYTDRIYFGTMMSEYLEVFAAFKGGSESGSCLRIRRSKWYCHTQWRRLFDPLTPLNSIAAVSFWMTPIRSTPAL
jgi:sugar lactone lactonase YvrE